jgi:hypothetical protein
MARRTRTLTIFGEDLDLLLKRAGKFTLREHADECAVGCRYLNQLRTIPERRRGNLYVDLLKPFARLRIIDPVESQRLSLKHRGKPPSFTECRELSPDSNEKELLASVRKSAGLNAPAGANATVAEPSETGTVIPTPHRTRGQLCRRVFIGRQTEPDKLRMAIDEATGRRGAAVMVAGNPWWKPRYARVFPKRWKGAIG